MASSGPDWQHLFDIALGVVATIGWWNFRNLHVQIQRISQTLHETREELPRAYASRIDQVNALNRIDDKLSDIEKELRRLNRGSED